MRETYSHRGPQCPYCGRQFTADDSYYYDEMNYTEETCDQCDKKFSVSVQSSVVWACEEIEDQPALTSTEGDRK
jgi:ribosomal protein L37AE/L43A